MLLVKVQSSIKEYRLKKIEKSIEIEQEQNGLSIYYLKYKILGDDELLGVYTTSDKAKKVVKQMEQSIVLNNNKNKDLKVYLDSDAYYKFKEIAMNNNIDFSEQVFNATNLAQYGLCEIQQHFIFDMPEDEDLTFDA